MKKIVLPLMLLTSQLFAQTDSTKIKFTPYTCVGVSVTNSIDFKESSFPSIEGGVSYKNISAGIVLGRGNFIGLGDKNDIIKNYYYEGKFTGSFPIGELTGNVIFGYGGFFDMPNNFIEYGFGLSLSKKKFVYGVTYSNWIGTNYLTPSIGLTF